MWSWKDKPKSTLEALLSDRETLLLEQMEIKHQLNLVDEKIEYFNSQSKGEASSVSSGSSTVSNTNTNNPSQDGIVTYSTDGMGTAR